MKSIINYLKNYKKWHTVIFLLVIFSNLEIGNFLLSDIIYGFFAVYVFLKFKKSPTNGIVIFYFITITLMNYIAYSNFRALLSTLRFDFGLIICMLLYSRFNNSVYRRKLVNGYCYACVLFSLFVLFQFFCYYVLKVNIDFSFGDYAREENSAGSYDVLSDLYYRTGGMFKEPSWYAAYVSPVLFILTIQKRHKELIICLVGLLASTSGLGFAILAIYAIWTALLFDKKVGTFVVFAVFLAYTYLPFLFNKLSGGVLGENSSFAIRIIEPFEILNNIKFSIIGINPSYHYDSSGSVMYFLNTFMFIYYYFGIIGLFLFLKFIFTKKIPILCISIIVVILIEGLYGRIDFWMMLLACLLFNSSTNEYKKNKNDIPHILGH